MSVEIKNSIKGLENYSPTVEQTQRNKNRTKKKIADNQTSQSNIQNIRDFRKKEQRRSNRAFFYKLPRTEPHDFPDLKNPPSA